LEQLISLLTHNIQFVLVILGILYYLFFRKSPAERRPPNRMPDFGENGGNAHRAPGNPAPRTEESRERRPEPRIFRETANPAPEARVYEAVAASPEGPSVAAPGMRRAQRPPEPYLTAETPVAVGTRRPGREEMAKAVLWSEIIGPPRAKRPFRR